MLSYANSPLAVASHSTDLKVASLNFKTNIPNFQKTVPLKLP